MKRLIVIRHCQTEVSDERKGRSSNRVLSSVGLAQAVLLATKLSIVIQRASSVFLSGYDAPTRQTAEIISKELVLLGGRSSHRPDQALSPDGFGGMNTALSLIDNNFNEFDVVAVVTDVILGSQIPTQYIDYGTGSLRLTKIAGAGTALIIDVAARKGSEVFAC